MTGKRFISDKWQVYDNDEVITVDETVDLLNDLNDKNEELEQRIKNKDCLIQQLRNALNTDYYRESQEYKRKFIRVCDELAEENELYRKLKKENEELKQKKDDLKELLMNSRTVLEQKKLQELIYNQIDYLIAGKIDEVYSKGENLQCIRVLTDLRREIKYE